MYLYIGAAISPLALGQPQIRLNPLLVLAYGYNFRQVQAGRVLPAHIVPHTCQYS